MSILSLTNDNILHLSKLENLVRKEYGVRFSLSEETSMLSLLNLAAESYNKTIKQALEHFINGLNEEQRRKLIYRGVEVTGDLKLDEKFVAQVSKKVYRGQQHPPSAVDGSHSNSNIAAKKIYRGQVIH